MSVAVKPSDAPAQLLACTVSWKNKLFFASNDLCFNRCRQWLKDFFVIYDKFCKIFCNMADRRKKYA
jgi:hypothetical protein